MASSHMNQHNEPAQKEITTKDLLLEIMQWWKYFWKKKLLIILFAALGAAAGLFVSFKMKPRYLAELTFVSEGSSSSPLGSYAGIASQFGIDLGMGRSSGIFEGDNIMMFLKSRLMVEKALLSPFTAGNTKQTLIERYITYNELRTEWEKVPELKNIHFPPGAPRTEFSLAQDSILNSIRKKIVDNYLKVDKSDKKLGFIEVSCLAPDELFAKVFTETLVTEAIAFYVDTKTKRTKGNVDRLQAQADSIQRMLNRQTYTAAATQDLNVNPARQMASVKSELALRDKVVLQTMYAEIVKNLEISKITMLQETPLIQIVDRPILPLEKKKLGKLKGLIIGGFLGGFLVVLYLAVKRIIQNILQDQ